MKDRDDLMTVRFLSSLNLMFASACNIIHATGKLPSLEEAFVHVYHVTIKLIYTTMLLRLLRFMCPLILWLGAVDVERALVPSVPTVTGLPCHNSMLLEFRSMVTLLLPLEVPPLVLLHNTLPPLCLRVLYL